MDLREHRMVPSGTLILHRLFGILPVVVICGMEKCLPCGELRDELAQDPLKVAQVRLPVDAEQIQPVIRDRHESYVREQRSLNVKVLCLLQRSPIVQGAELLSGETLPLKDNEECLEYLQRFLPSVVECQLGVQFHEAAYLAQRKGQRGAASER